MQQFKKGKVYHFHSIILRTISLTKTQESATKASTKVKKLQNLISQHRQLGVRPHHVCDDSKVLAEYRIKEIEKFHSAMNEDFQNQFQNAYDHDRDYIHGKAHKQLETCFGFVLVIV